MFVFFFLLLHKCPESFENISASYKNIMKLLYLIYWDICTWQKYISAVLKAHVSVIIWYLEIQSVTELWWWRFVQICWECRRRRGLINCGAHLGPVGFLFPNLNNLFFKENVPKIWKGLLSNPLWTSLLSIVDFRAKGTWKCVHLKTMHGPS